MEADPLAELDQLLGAGNWSEAEAEELTFQFALHRSAQTLLQAMPSFGKGAGRPAQLLGAGRFIMTGVVRDDHFHVFDTLSTGYSHRELTEESPTYSPIPLQEIAQNAAREDILLYLEPLG